MRHTRRSTVNNEPRGRWWRLWTGLGRPRLLVAFALSAVLGGLCYVIAAQSWAEAPPPRAAATSPRAAAEEVRRQAELALQEQTLGGAQRPQRRHGLYVFVSFALPDEALKKWLHEAHLLGATVVLRGLIDDDFRKTLDVLKQWAMGFGEHVPHVVIDPILFRQLQITAVPTLAVVDGNEALLVTGAAELEYLLTVLTREDQGLKPVLAWYGRRQRGWLAGGKTEEAPPGLPPVKGVKAVPTDLPRYPIAERDLEKVFRERVAKTDWNKIMGEVRGKMAQRLRDGPNVALKPATVDRQFTVDLTVTYPEDIREPKSGTVLVKAGSRMNPLTVVTWTGRLVVIDGREASQVAFARAQVQRYGRANVKVLLTAGDVLRMTDDLQARVYWVLPELVERFKLEAVPSVVRQQGPVIIVEEHHV